MTASAEPLLRTVALEKTYPPLSPGAPGLTLFRELELTLFPGEMVAIVGESGAGKSTLLHLLAALDHPTSGQVLLTTERNTGRPTNISALTPSQAAAFRNREIGYVWQFHYLLPEFTALENIALPLLARGTSKPQALLQAALWLDRVGLAARAQNRSGELSGGEQQRVSIARALVTGPRLLLADEPTGDLDSATAERLFALLLDLHRTHGLTSLLVTHNQAFARRCDRVLRLHDGRLHPE
jgi:lipoprotein-releasing system ATP-binding protein